MGISSTLEGGYSSTLSLILLPIMKLIASSFLRSPLVKFLTALKILFIPGSNVVRYDSFPFLTASDSVDPVPVYCLDRASALSAQRFLYKLEKGELPERKASPFLNSLIYISK